MKSETDIRSLLTDLRERLRENDKLIYWIDDDEKSDTIINLKYEGAMIEGQINALRCVLQNANPIDKVIGRWPGDETAEELIE